MRYRSLADLWNDEKENITGNCTLCGLCLEACPVFPLLGFDHKSPSELQEERINGLKGGPITKETYDMVWACSRCAHCLDACPEELDPFAMQYILRAELVRRGHKPPESPPRRPPEPYSDVRILSHVPNESDESGQKDVVYFPGCNAVLKPTIVYHMLDILDRIDVDYVSLAGSYGDVCCGSPHLTKGEPEKAEQAARNLISAVTRFRPAKLVLKCPGCMNRLKNLFSKFIHFDFEVQYVSEYLNENLDKSTFTQPIEKTVTLHDSCNLGRGCGDYESVRKLLRSIPGIRLVEMEHNRENAGCCYSAPAFGWYPGAGKIIRGQTLADAGNSGAQILATGCGGCMRTFAAEKEKDGSGLSFLVEDFITIVAEAMGIIYPARRFV